MQLPPTEANESKSPLRIAIVFFALAQGFSFFRIFFGVNFFDEAYYIALPFRFLFEQRLFVQDNGLGQTIGLLLYPLIKLHVIFFHSTEFIVLAMRIWFFVLYLALPILLVILLRKLLPASALLTIFSCCGLFLPGNLPTLSYNTCGTFFLTLGFFLLFYAWYHEKTLFYFLSGSILGLAILSYLTYLFLLLFVCVVISLINKKLLPLVLFCFAAVLVLCYPVFLAVTRYEFLKDTLEFYQQNGYKINGITSAFQGIHRLFPKQVVLVLFTYLFFAFYKSKGNPKLANICLLLLPVVAGILTYLSTLGWSALAIYLSMLGLVPISFASKERLNNGLIWLIYVPSVVAGIIVSITSAIGITNSQIGLVPAVLVSLIFLYRAIQLRIEGRDWIKLVSLGSPVLCALLTPIAIWDESHLSELSVPVAQGPYKGIYTSPEKEAYLRNISHLLLISIDSSGPLMIYPNFTAGYLIAGVAPAAGTLWYSNSGGGVDACLAKAYKSQMNESSRVLRMKQWYAHPRLFSNNRFDPESPINKMLAQDHYVLKDNEWFTLFAPKKNNQFLKTSNTK